MSRKVPEGHVYRTYPLDVPVYRAFYAASPLTQYGGVTDAAVALLADGLALLEQGHPPLPTMASPFRDRRSLTITLPITLEQRIVALTAHHHARRSHVVNAALVCALRARGITVQ